MGGGRRKRKREDEDEGTARPAGPTGCPQCDRPRPYVRTSCGIKGHGSKCLCATLSTARATDARIEVRAEGFDVRAQNADGRMDG